MKLVFLGLTIFSMVAAAIPSPCPDRIKYTNGQYLKNGDNFYYRNGNYLLRSDVIYYPNGQYLRRSDNVYYTNGNYLQRADNLYYPNGNYLKRAQNYYYANGQYFKRETNFYYSNGRYARRNGKLYRADGTETAWPIYLSEFITDIGMLEANVTATSDRVDIDFNDLVVNADGVTVRALWNGLDFSHFDLLINSGAPHENVFVHIQEGQTRCTLPLVSE